MDFGGTNLFNIINAEKGAITRLLQFGFGLVVLFAVVTSRAAVAQDDGDISNQIGQLASQATVFLTQTYDAEGEQVFSCVGSGTLVSSNGLILTNARLASDLGACRGERIIVSLPSRADDPPVPTYLAEIVQLDVRTDLAILQITSSLGGNPINPDALNLPFVTVGDPFTLQPGNQLTFVGYPNTGSSNVEVTQAPITGITREKIGGALAWHRISEPLAGTISGGGAYDSNGALVGIPTSAPAGDGTETSDTCLNIQDTTGDGVISPEDACVPVGAPVTAIRPVNFAFPLIEAAQNDFRLINREGLFFAPPPGDPVIDRVFFSTGVSTTGVPTDMVDVAPGGTSGLFIWFDYFNMRDGTSYEIRISRDGSEMSDFSIGPITWGGGSSGTWYYGVENTSWPDGNYEFSVVLEGETAATGSVRVSGREPVPTFRNLKFRLPNVESDAAAGSSVLLPAEVPQIDAEFEFENMVAEQAWTEVWYLDGAEVSRNARIWEGATEGSQTVSATNVDGLPLGDYRLELYIGERLAATGDITLAGSRSSRGTSAIFANPETASGITRDGEPDGQTGSVQPVGIPSIYLFFDWDLLPTGTTWTYRWFLDGRLVASSTQSWDAGGVGENYYVAIVSDDPLPEGSYAVEVLVENNPMFSETVTIGAGTQPVEGATGETDEIFISGTVTDALTGEGIPGALVFLLNVEFESPQFLYDEEQILTQDITDREGRFSWSRGVPRANFYTLYVFADGYITIIEDNFTIPGTTESPQDIRIEMSQP